MSQIGFAWGLGRRSVARQPRVYWMSNVRVTLQPRQFRTSNVNRTRIISAELRTQVDKTFKELLGFNSVQIIKGQLDSIVRTFGKCCDLILQEKQAVVGLEERQKRNPYCRCETASFIKEYDPLIESLDETCKRNHKSLTCFETGLLLHCNNNHPLLLAVNDLHQRNKLTSKTVARIARDFYDYRSRFEIEVAWISLMAKRLEGNSELFAMAVSKITDLQSKVIELSEIFNDLLVYAKDNPQDFNIQISSLRTLGMLLESVSLYSKFSSWVEEGFVGLCSVCENVMRLLIQKRFNASRFLRIEQNIMSDSPETRQSVDSLEQEVSNIRTLYNETMSRLSEDVQGHESTKYIFKKAKGHSDLSWRWRKWKGRNIAPAMRKQGRGKCGYVSTVSCTESLYKRMHSSVSTVGGKSYQPDEFILKLSPDHLEDLVVAFLQKYPRKASHMLDVILERMKADGVLTEEAYKNANLTFEHYQRYRIKEFEALNVANVVAARDKLNNGIALIGNFKITTDYHRLGKNDVYQIQKGAVFETNTAGQTCSHSVVILGYGATEDGLPYYIFQNSYGTTWGSKGYGRVACDSLKYLYSANV